MNIDLKLLSLPFKEDEIEWRIQSCGKKGNGQVWAICLAYVQARAIMDRLDVVCGPENWRAEYSFPVSGSVLCKLSIKCGDSWITKEDGAEQTEIEPFKGGISSALKRAASVWGMGRYLYRLEAGFANIVQTKTAASRYGKTKEGEQFNWEAPKLPQWALPEGEKADTNGIHPEQPQEGDGVQIDGVEIPYGPCAKQMVHKANMERFHPYLLEEKKKWDKRKLTSPPDWAKKMVEAAKPLVMAYESAHPELKEKIYG